MHRLFSDCHSAASSDSIGPSAPSSVSPDSPHSALPLDALARSSFPEKDPVTREGSAAGPTGEQSAGLAGGAIPKGTPFAAPTCTSTAASAAPDYPLWLATEEETAGEDSFEMVSDGETEDEATHLPWTAHASRHCNGCASCFVPLGSFCCLPGEASHHCVLCGDAFCDACSSYWTLLPHMGHHTKQRCCKACHTRATGNRCPVATLPASCRRQRATAPLPGWLCRLGSCLLSTAASARP